MKKFEMAEVIIEKLDVVDVITTSDDDGYVPGPNDTPIL